MVAGNAPAVPWAIRSCAPGFWAGSGRGWGVVFVPVVPSGVGAQTQDRVPGAAQAVRGYWGAPGRPGQVAELACRAM